MITSVPHSQLAHLSFPDSLVESIGLDLHTRRLALRVDGAWLDNQGLRSIGPGELVITDWAHLTVRVYHHQTDQWLTAEFTPLRDICEFHVDSSRIVLRGFAKDSGLWTELAAIGVRLHAIYNVLNATK